MGSADRNHAARPDVGDAHRLPTMGAAIQRAGMERVLRASAVSLLSSATRLLEWRTRNYRGPGSQRRRIAARRNRSAPINGSVARTRLSRIRNSWDELWRLDRRFAG